MCMCLYMHMYTRVRGEGVEETSKPILPKTREAEGEREEREGMTIPTGGLAEGEIFLELLSFDLISDRLITHQPTFSFHRGFLRAHREQLSQWNEEMNKIPMHCMGRRMGTKHRLQLRSEGPNHTRPNRSFYPIAMQP